MLEPGKVIGERYEILERIGAGGMSIVYLAKCHKLQRHVAIKVLREEFATDEEFVKKFRAEALSAASLSHPNVVGIYDVGIEEELKYIVMEYVEGETLKEYLRKHGQFTSAQTLEFGMQIVSAIKHAHKRQIIHRDIKPQNILITHEHVLKVADFGIARAVDSSTIVATGNAIGSVHYFSPEQAKGKYVNETSDLYSCGIVLFELVTNQLPFQADSHVTIALKHINDELPVPSTIVPDIYPGLNQLIVKATAKNQESRYQNADEMLEDMKAILINPNISIVVEEDKDDYTILLTPEETEYLRSNEQAVPNVEQYFEEDDENEEDDEKISFLYKFLVGFGAFSITMIIMVGAIFMWFFWKPVEKGAEALAMPEVIGMTVEQAEELLGKNGFTLKVVDNEVNEEMKNGEISKQDPKPKDIVTPGTEVSVTVINNPQITEVQVINVTGIESGEAQKKLKGLGLETIIVREYSDTLEMGKVIKQQPEEGAVLEEGKVVTLTISKGPEVVKVSVPNLYNLTEEQAKISLRNAGLTLGKVTTNFNTSIEAGKVYEQGIGATTEVQSGTPIDITVSKGPEEAPTPEEGTDGEESVGPGEEIEKPGANEGGNVTKTHTIMPLDNTSKEEHHILVILESNDGEDIIFDAKVKGEDLPLTLQVSKEGTLVTYFDGREEYRDEIIFDEVTQ